VSWEEVFLIVYLPLFLIFLVSRHDKSYSLTPRPPEEWMTKGLALVEMPEIDYHIAVCSRMRYNPGAEMLTA
jgi:hypothetical protein